MSGVESKPHSELAEHLRTNGCSRCAEAADLVEQLESVEEQERLAKEVIEGMKEQLETAQKALREIAELPLDPTLTAYQHLEVARSRARAAYPASDPLGLDQADRDFAEGKARPASEVFADLGLDSNDTKPQ